MLVIALTIQDSTSIDRKWKRKDPDYCRTD